MSTVGLNLCSAPNMETDESTNDRHSINILYLLREYSVLGIFLGDGWSVKTPRRDRHNTSQ
jgi:hypothetical protein